MTIEMFLCLHVSVRVNCAIVVNLKNYGIRKTEYTFTISKQKLCRILKVLIENDIGLFLKT